ncbi:MAG: hypothetical protein K9M02_03065 [Thiohalocapsa sp.]|nr:hypothetical protein [Thiohalocapsa sp.]
MIKSIAAALLASATMAAAATLVTQHPERSGAQTTAAAGDHALERSSRGTRSTTEHVQGVASQAAETTPRRGTRGGDAIGEVTAVWTNGDGLRRGTRGMESS